MSRICESPIHLYSCPFSPVAPPAVAPTAVAPPCGEKCGLTARRLKQLGNSLQKGFGPIPAKMLNEALEDCQREVDAVFSHDLENDIDSDA